MKNQEITVFYKWTANPGKFDELNPTWRIGLKILLISSYFRALNSSIYWYTET